jgi:hypothetical protein
MQILLEVEAAFGRANLQWPSPSPRVQAVTGRDEL